MSTKDSNTNDLQEFNSPSLLPTIETTSPSVETPESIENILLKHNLTVDNFIVALKEGLQASKDIKDRYGDPLETIPDHSTRHKFFQSGMLLLGYLKDNNVVVNVGLSKELEEVDKICEKWGRG